MQKILMIGPFPEPVHGQSMANKILFDGLKSKGYKVDNIDTTLLSKIEGSDGLKKSFFKKLFMAFGKMFSELFKMLFNRYDLVYITPGHSFLGFMRYSPYILICRLKNLPYFLHSHGGRIGNTYREAGGLKKRMLKFFIKKTSGAIVLGDSLKWMFEGIVPEEKIFVCHNGVPAESASDPKEVQEKIGSKSKVLNLLYLSNLMKEKGIMDIFKSLEYFQKSGIDFKLKIAGNIEKKLEERIMSYFEKYKERVRYLGVVGGEEKRELFLESDIFILPTYYPIEGQPISILEAMINGCAIVTTDQGGIGDIFKDGLNGVQCQKKDPYSIYLAVLNTSKNLKKIQKLNYEIAKAKYKQSDFVERLDEIIRQY